MRADKMAFEVGYDDSSGCERAVRMDVSCEAREIELERHGQIVHFALADLQWLLDALDRIKWETRPERTP